MRLGASRIACSFLAAFAMSTTQVRFSQRLLHLVSRRPVEARRVAATHSKEFAFSGRELLRNKERDRLDIAAALYFRQRCSRVLFPTVTRKPTIRLQSFVGGLHRKGDLLDWSRSPEPNVENRQLPTVSLGCSHVKGIDKCMATIHAASLEYQDMSSVSRWAASVRWNRHL